MSKSQAILNEIKETLKQAGPIRTQALENGVLAGVEDYEVTCKEIQAGIDYLRACGELTNVGDKHVLIAQ